MALHLLISIAPLKTLVNRRRFNCAKLIETNTVLSERKEVVGPLHLFIRMCVSKEGVASNVLEERNRTVHAGRSRQSLTDTIH